MFIRIILSFTVILAFFSTTATAEESEVLEDLAKLFAKKPNIIDMSLSPGGDYFALVIQQSEEQQLRIVDVTKGEVTHQVNFDTQWKFGELYWANDERVLVQPAYQPRQTNVVFRTAALYAVNFDGRKEKFLLGPGAGAKLGSKAGKRDASLGAFVLDLRRDDRRKVLVEVLESGNKRASTAWLDVYNGKLSKRRYGPELVRNCDFAIDLEGNPKFCVTSDRDSDLPKIYESSGPRAWSLVYQASNWDEQPSVYDQLNNGKVLALLDHPDTSTSALYEISSSKDGLNKRLVNHSASFDPLTINYSARLDWGYVLYASPLPEYAYLGENQDLNALHRGMLAAFPRSFVTLRSVSADQKLILVRVSNELLPSRFFLWDATNKNMSLIANAAEHLVDRTSRVEPFSMKARDGFEMNGLVTEAKGKSRGTVINVHGGPHGPFDYFRYDADTQYFASIGLNVIQPNFRGSGGFGRDYQRAGYGEWGAKMQDDLTDVTAWAVEQGYADANQICIYGGSYGGYAALAGAAFEPDLYQCAVGHVGVYDLEELYRSGDIPEARSGVRYLERVIGSDKDELRRRSPTNYAQRIKAAVLLTAGLDDERAPPVQTRLMSESLTRAGVNHRVSYEKREGHGFFSEETESNRLKMVGDFILQHVNNSDSR
jgi:dipeptidyl aminopeptidase/acylaminoacyl peptidase